MPKATGFILALCLFAASVAAQPTGIYSAFSIVDKEVVWSQVYHAEHPADTLERRVWQMLVRKPWVRNVQRQGNDLVADIEKLRVDYKRFGGKYLNSSQLIRTGRWSGKIRISFRDGKYRVIVYGLEYDARQPAMHAGKMSNEAHPIHGTWTEWVLNKYRTRFLSSRHTYMDMMHACLKENFTLPQTAFIDEDW